MECPEGGNTEEEEEDELEEERRMGFSLASTESGTEQRCGSPGVLTVAADQERLPDLNDDLWLMVFSGLDIRDRVMLEGGVRGGEEV